MENLTERLEKMTPLQRAVYALKETRARLESVEQKQAEPIAIVGMACRLPGGADDPESYWRLLRSGINAVGEIPPDRWNVDDFYDPDPTAPGKMNTRWGGFIDGIDRFDNRFFGISDREAERIDPMHRLVLELAWEALEDAGLPISRLRGSRTGVFIGLSHSEYGMMLSSDQAQTDAFVSTGTAHCMAANRISFAFDFYGPSMVLDTACSSSLVSVHLACQSIRHGDADLALAGGVNAILSPMATVNLTKAGFSAADGRVRAFDAGATGYVRGEGAGVVVLKPLSAALKDKDPIYAVVRGSAVNQNGSSNGLTAPSSQAQQRVLREAYSRSKLSPGRVQYVETQGTGTPLGDAVEAKALGEVLSEDRPPGSRCAIGSVKTNLGHLEAASGIASLMKVALAMQHGVLPPMLHFERPNPDIPFERLPLRIQQQLEPWPESDEPKLAGVSAFGFGGSNAHVVMQGAPVADEADPEPEPAVPGSAHLLPLSARTEKALRELTRRYAILLKAEDAPAWTDLCYAAIARRDHHDCRLAVLATSPDEAWPRLEASLREQPSPGLFRGRKPFGRDLKVAFVYDGRADLWRNHAAAVIRLVPDIEELDALAERVAGWTLTAALSDESVWDDPARAIVAATLLQLALTAWWRSVGAAPQVVVGRGAGELAAASAAGVITAEDALRVAVACGRGDGDQAFAELSCGSASLPFLSALDGQAHNGRDLDPVRWQACLDCSDGLDDAIGNLQQRQVDICLEIGPESLLPSLRNLAGKDGDAAVTAASLGPAVGDAPAWIEAIGRLYAAGVDFAWDRIAPPGGRHVRLPTYPWQRHRLWAARKDWFTKTGDGPRQNGDDRGEKSPVAGDAAVLSDPAFGIQAGPRRPRPDMNTPFAAPRRKLERAMARSWSEILSIEEIGVHDNFFELGGDSLQATILLNTLQEQLNEEVPAQVLFQVQTIAELADVLRRDFADAVGRRYGDETMDDSAEPQRPHDPAPDAAPAGEAVAEATTPEKQNGKDKAAPGKTAAPRKAPAIPRLARSSEADQFLSRLDELSDEEVSQLLGKNISNSELPNE